MRKFFLFFIVFALSIGLETQAALVENQPYQITQPDGAVINCFVSGDEFFNWLHDANGFTIIQADDGYFYYAVTDKGRIVPSQYIVESVNPADTDLKPWVKISKQEYLRRKQMMDVSDNRSNRAPHQGAFNNLAVYIRFSGDAEFTNIRQYYDDIFNITTGNSVKTYYTEVTYNMLDVNTTHYPQCAMTTNLSYTDSHPRSYFEPYNATTNPGGYNGDSQRTSREHTLLKDAITWINANSPIPAGLNIDGDNDGQVDNVAFIIRGGNGAWASLLWAHRWALYSQYVYINGKRVYDYTFQPETQVNVKTLCHEFFHALGAPDLYHYNGNGISPAGPWDLMESGGGHMGAYMKWKYSGNTWISSIPEITASGTYTLNPLTSSTNNCFKIASPYSSSQYFVVEYRQKTGTFESNLPGSGLLVYRVDPSYNGNAQGPPDEVYIYRPDGTTTINGIVNSAFYSLTSGRTAINDGSNPSSFLQNGNAGGLNIYNVTAAGTTISFTVGLNSIENPNSFTASAISGSQINLQWVRNTAQNNIILTYNTTSSFGIPTNGTNYTTGNQISGGGTVIYAGSAQSFQHLNLNAGTTYYYKIWSVDGTTTYSTGITASANTTCGVQSLPFTESFSGTDNIPACWSQQISGSNAVANWGISQSNNAGGIEAELVSTYQNINPGVNRLILPVFNTTGMNSLNLSFKHMLDAYGAGATLKVQSSTNGTSWTNEAWVLQSGENNVGPAAVNTTITSNLNSPNTYIAFTVEGNMYQYDYWYVDDISLTNGTVQTFNISTTSNPVAGGSTSGSGNYNQGVQATVLATANTGYTFTNWTEGGTVVSSDANYSFTVQGNRSLVANFATQAYNISATVNPANSGTVSGAGSYNYGSQANLTATANTGYTFTNWTEGGTVVSGDANYTFTVQGNRNLVANFTVQSFTISASVNPANSGSVSGAGSYNYGSQANLTATANTGYTFTNWTEGGSMVSSNASYTFSVQGNRSLVANFATLTYNISATVNPANSGTVSGAGSYSFGSQATLSATANTGYTFTNWTEGGTVVSSDANYTFSVQGNRSLVANFTVQSFTISASANPANSGTLSGAGNYTFGSQATLSATANTGYTFTNWTEGGTVVSSDANYTFTVQGNRALVANFTPIQYSITVSANPSNGGSVSGGGNYAFGSQALLAASSANGWNFTNWTENGNVVSTSANYSFTVNGNRTLVANFTQQIIEYTITTSSNPVEGGSTQGGGIYEAGQTVILTATPANDWNFVEWTENGTPVSSSATYSFTAQSDRNLVANFAMEQFEVLLLASPANAGSVAGAGWYNAGSTATAIATASTGYNFTAWTLNGNVVSTSLTYSFTVNNTTTLTAEFEPLVYNIQTASNPVAGGTTTGAGSYNYGETVNLQAISANGWVFENWTENGTIVSTQPLYAFMAEADRTLVANFIQQSTQYNITAFPSPSNAGTITGTGAYYSGQTATLSAVANNLWAFVNWTENGNIVSTQQQYSFLVTADRSLMANFVRVYNIVANPNPTNSGQISGAGYYTEGETVELEATANQDYVFIDWTENGNTVSTEPKLTFMVNGDRQLTARFQLTVGIGEMLKPGINLYPNPSRGEFIIESNETAGSISKVTVTSITGNVILEIKNPMPVQKLNIDLSTQAESVYFVNITTKNGLQIIKKLILKK